MQLDLVNIIHLLITFQSWLFAVVLWGKRGGKQISNRLLGAFLFALGFQMLLYLLADQGYGEGWHMGFVGIVFAYGPLMFLYARSLIWRHFQMRHLDWGHFLPAVLFILAGLLGFDLRTRAGWLLYLSIGIYLGLAFREINRYRRILTQTRSSGEGLNLAWLKLALSIFTIVIFADLFSFLINRFAGYLPVVEILDYVVLGLALFFVNVMVYKGLKQPELFAGIGEEDSHILPAAKPKDAGNNVFPEMEALVPKLEGFMTKEEPFRNPQLTISDLAAQLDMPARQLSALINQHYRQNFSDFINTYRIELACQRLRQPADPQETILEVLYDVGFNSKSSFNTLFKTKMGMTPTTYKRKFNSSH